jgi:hypothetical protein
VLAVILTSGGGGRSNSKSAAAAASTTGVHTSRTHAKSHTRHVSTETSSSAASRAETNVAVLNGTETSNLAHSISNNLHQSGYTRATPLNGRPPGANQVTVVEYTSGHQADAQGVARSLSVTRVQPVESGAAALAGSASVVVIVGLDKAATVP